MHETRQPSRLKVGAALLALYVVWGSTYLAIAFAIGTIPPFTMAAVRFTLAGWVLYGLLRLRGYPAPTGREWLATGFIGLLLLGVANGAVTWAELRVPSGVAALIVAGTPAWMMLMEWLRPGGVRPLSRVIVGIALGLAGIALLVFARGDLRVESIDPIGALALMISSVSWALGSITSRSMKLPKSAAVVTAMQMIAAGAALSVVSGLSGEWSTFDVSAVTLSSVTALGYLIVVGSWIGFSAYVWLLKSTTPAIASTYAFVNPAVAVFLGWAIAGESVDRWMFGAMAVIIAGVALITTGKAGGGGAGEKAVKRGKRGFTSTPVSPAPRPTPRARRSPGW